MSCAVNLNDALTGETLGGTFVFDFYDSNADGAADNGGSSIFIDSNNVVDFNGAVIGRYYFTYTIGDGDCEVSQQFYITVLGRPNAGIGTSISLCVGDDLVNLFSLLNGTPDLTGVWSGDGTTSNDYAANTADPLDDEFTPNVAGVYNFIYTVSAIAPNGIEVVNCENCNDDSATITVTVLNCVAAPCDQGLPNTIQVCSVSGCSFDLFSQIGGTPDINGAWTLLAGAPMQIIPTGGYLGSVNFIGAAVGTYQYEYDLSGVDPSCTDTVIITVIVVPMPNAGNNISLNVCETLGNTNLFNLITGNPQSGGYFTITPELPAGTFTSNGFINPAIGDAGVYTVTYIVENPTNNSPCAGNCIDTSIITITIAAACTGGTSSGSTICQTGGTLTLNAVTLLGGTAGGQWLVVGQAVNCNAVYGASSFSVNGAPVSNHQSQFLADGSVLTLFQSLGCIKFTYICNAQCNGSNADYILNVTNCTPSCAASVSISAVACALSSLITGTCPAPIYEWQVFNGTVFVPAPVPNNTNSYTGLNGNRYRLKVTNCTNCGILYSNEIVVSCPPNACTIVCDSFIYNVSLQRLEAQWTHNNGDGNGTSVQYWFNKCIVAASPCSSCNAWGVNQGGGTGNNATTGILNIAQTSVAQCFRIVIQDLPVPNPLCQVICYVTIPALTTTMCYELVDMLPFTDVVQLFVNTGGADFNILGAAQFGCTEYESTEPTGNVNGIINCSYAQLVYDINQWLVANGFLGTATIRQSAKSSTIRIKDTNVTFKRIVSNVQGNKDFVQFSNGCELCNAMPVYHFQGVTAPDNFPSIGYLNPSIAGNMNLFTMLDLYFEEIPHTGTFTAAVCTGVTGGCVDINTNCCNAGAAPVTVVNNLGFADHGDINWIAFVPTNTICWWSFRYLVTLANGCQECVFIQVKFNDNL